MKIYHYPPIVSPDSIEYVPIQGAIPPRLHPGYVADKANAWRQVSEWEPCSHRQIDVRERKCGAAFLTMLCQCEGCPLNKRIVTMNDCEGCPHAK